MQLSPGLMTDLYQLTMAVGYLKRGMAHTPAICEAFVRRLPRRRSFLLTAGLQRIVEYLEAFRFDEAQVEYLRRQQAFAGAMDDETCEALLGLRFEGDLWAMPEGTLAFAGEPMLRVEAPLWQAQLVETNLLSIMNHSTMIASKAARVVAAAGEAGVLEFGSRRTHDKAAVNAARSAYLAGCLGTSNVEAGFRHGVPIFGTMAHMWVMCHESEEAAFHGYLDVYSQGTTLLIDTYDIVRGTRRACVAARDRGGQALLKAVRVDAQLFDGEGAPTGICRQVREVLDEEGFGETRVVASGDLNEYRIETLLQAGEPIDAFGVGTELVNSKDAPSLGGVYKVVQVGGRESGRPVIKLSAGKVTWPGPHQVFRRLDHEGMLLGDTLALDHEQHEGRPVLEQIMRGGEVVATGLDDLEAHRARARQNVALLSREKLLAEQDAVTAQPSAELAALLSKCKAEWGE